MVGGTWTTQNKVRPGVYVNVETSGGALGTVGSRGITSLALTLPWGAAKVITPIIAGEDTFKALGYDITAPELLLVREALKELGQCCCTNSMTEQSQRSQLGPW